MKLLKEYFDLQKKVYLYFAYREDWKVIPLDDATEYFWALQQDPDGAGFVRFAKNKADLYSSEGNYYENEIYTQRFLKKWVYEGLDNTMIVVDTHTDDNKLLQVFDNAKRYPLKEVAKP